MSFAPFAPRARIVLVVALVAATGAGCGRQPNGATAQPIASAAAAESAGAEDAGRGEGYSFRIRYPELDPRWPALTRALHVFAAENKREFLGFVEADDGRPAGASPYWLNLDFAVARRTADFVSVLASGGMFTGGAHGMPISASFNLHLADGRLVELGDLFDDPRAALAALSEECRRQLEGRFEANLREQIGEGKALAPALERMRDWVARGTEPVARNFAVFLIDGLDGKAIGLTVIFPPYQVASYADGEQQVEVPAKVFHALLKPEYRDAFLIDSEADGRGAR